MKRFTCLLITLLLLLCMVSTSALATVEPVTVNIMGKDVTFDSVPERVVALSYSNAEIFAALGLGDKIVAAFPGMYVIDDVLEENRAAVEAMPFITEGLNSGTPNLETVLEQDPDFVVGTFYNFTEKSCGTVDDYSLVDAHVYANEGTYVNGVTIENTYNDILNIGKIFRIEDKAVALVEKMRAKADLIAGKLADVQPVRTFVYDSGEDKILTIGNAGLEQKLLAAAGGENVFDDQEARFFRTSIEGVIDANPDAIVIFDYSISTKAEDKIAYLKSLPELADVPAVKNETFVIVPIYAMFPSVQNAEAIETMARGLHPEIFE